MTSSECPFCQVQPKERLFYQDELVQAIWDGYPVSPGHALIIPRRHVADWFEATDAEHLALTRAINVAREEILKSHKPDGFNIGVNAGRAAGQTVFHLHLHLIPRYEGDVPDPRGGVRHVIPRKANYLASEDEPLPLSSPFDGGQSLVRGDGDPLLPHLIYHIDGANKVEMAVAFVLPSGLDRIEGHLRDLLKRGGSVRFLTGDYFDVTDPDALVRLLDLEGDVELRIFETKGLSFHPKAYLFYGREGTGLAFVGSSNLTARALTKGVEWNYRVFSPKERGGDFEEVARAFEQLFYHPHTRPLDREWVEDYRRRRTVALPAQKVVEVVIEPPAAIPQPHEVQAEALGALEETRTTGNAAGLVVLATGLGKTYLSAFDSDRPEFRRVLFVAHREEILAQAMQTFRRVRPAGRFGHYTGKEKNINADVLFASIQTLGRGRHLYNFSPDDFDYIVVDEFHHASAPTYRRLINYFKPKFLLGLTATPERTDGGDLLALCQENLVYRRDLFDGIRLGLLSPFHYFGVPDEVDYANIPWRSSRFDQEELTRAVATQSRARNAFEQHRRRAGRRTLAFCSSQRHADFMANFFRAEGLRAVAVHAGEGSAPRATSLEQLGAGELDVIFAVDIFNEGLDLPEIDTVMMLRPTESRILWLQQFGRGLRRAEGKDHLTVIDYIGNHRTFLTKPRALFELGAADIEIANALQLLRAGSAGLPPGCEVTYDLEAINILQGLLRLSRPGALNLYYEDFRDRHGIRPCAVEVFHDGYKPGTARKGYGSWLRFVRAMGDLTLTQSEVLEKFSGLLDALETTQMTKSFKMLVLLTMLNRDRFPGKISIEELMEGFTEIVGRSAKLRDDIGPALTSRKALQELIENNPIKAWVEGKGTGGVAFFAYQDGLFRLTSEVSGTEREDLQELVRELAEWRLAEYLQRTTDASEGVERIVCKVSHSSGRPLIFLDRSKYPHTPEGWTEVLADGENYRAHFVKIAINVIQQIGSENNELPALMRRWFGPDAGLPGTNFLVSFNRENDKYVMKPVNPTETRNELELGRSYSREQIPTFFGAQFNRARWQTGFVTLPGHLILLVTLNKGDMEDNFQYLDRFLTSDTFEWQSQNRTSQQSGTGQAIQNHREKGISVHLFVRKDRRNSAGGAAPFTYCGELEFLEWERDRPITVRWRLLTPLPSRLWQSFGLNV